MAVAREARKNVLANRGDTESNIRTLKRANRIIDKIGEADNPKCGDDTGASARAPDSPSSSATPTNIRSMDDVRQMVASFRDKKSRRKKAL